MEIATWCIINNKIVLPKLVDKVKVWNYNSNNFKIEADKNLLILFMKFSKSSLVIALSRESILVG